MKAFNSINSEQLITDHRPPTTVLRNLSQGFRMSINKHLCEGIVKESEFGEGMQDGGINA